MNVRTYPRRVNPQSGRQEVSPCLPICPTADDAQETAPLQFGCLTYTYVGVFVHAQLTRVINEKYRECTALKVETVLTQISGQWRNMAELGV